MRYLTAFALSSLALPAGGATIDKIFAAKSAMIVVLDSDEKSAIKVGADLIVQEDGNQPDALTDADVVFIAGGKALLTLSAMSPNDKVGQRVHLFCKDAPEGRKAKVETADEAALPQAAMPDDKRDRQMNQRFADLDNSIDQTFGTMNDMFPVPKEETPRQEIKGPSIVLTLLKPPPAGTDATVRVKACNNSGILITEAQIELTLTNKLLGYESTITLTSMADKSCVVFSIAGVDAKNLLDDTVVVIGKTTVNKGTAAIKAYVVLTPPPPADVKPDIKPAH